MPPVFRRLLPALGGDVLNGRRCAVGQINDPVNGRVNGGTNFRVNRRAEHLTEITSTPRVGGGKKTAFGVFGPMPAHRMRHRGQTGDADPGGAAGKRESLCRRKANPDAGK